MSDEHEEPKIPTPPWPFVEVVWEDSSASHDTWILEEEMPDTAIIISRGWLVKETKRSVKIAASCAHWESTNKWIFGEHVTIPKKALLGEPRVISA